MEILSKFKKICMNNKVGGMIADVKTLESKEKQKEM